MASQIRIATNIWRHFWSYLYNIKQEKSQVDWHTMLQKKSYIMDKITLVIFPS